MAFYHLDLLSYLRVDGARFFEYVAHMVMHAPYQWRGLGLQLRKRSHDFRFTSAHQG
jgi:hypothetical protein